MSRHRPVAILVSSAGAAVLAAVFVTVLAGVLASDAARAQEAPEKKGPAAGDVVLDPAYFRAKVLPLLDQRCMGCHDADDPENKTRHRLLAPGADGRFDDATVQRNYDVVRSFMDARTPERSTLLLKLLPVSRGGIDHDGGKADDSDFPTDLVDARSPLIAWAFGATAADAPPVAAWAPAPRQVEVGAEVRLDGSLSFDPEGKPLTVAWEVHDAPQGAKARPAEPGAAVTTIVPDREGPWTVRLRVHDGKLGGWPALLRFAAVRKRTPAAADAPVVPAAQVDSAERRAVRQLHLDLWGRTPTDEELARLAALTPERRVDALLASDDTWRNWLEEECFYFLLIDQFRPVSDRVAAVPAALREGRITFRDAHQAIALSSEFNARNPGNDTYCTVVLEQFLGMEVQKNVRVLEAAKTAYDGKPARLFNTPVRSQSDVLRTILEQRAYTDVFVRRMERRLLSSDLPAAEHAATVDVLHARPEALHEILREWLLSDRYRGADRLPHRKNDLQFIRSLFVDLLGRPPAYEEFRNMRNALQALADPAPLRGVLAKVLLDSSAAVAPPVPPDPERYPGDRWRPQVTELFRRLLGRDPSTREIQVFVEILQEPGATWRTAALGILSSPQYQYY